MSGMEKPLSHGLSFFLAANFNIVLVVDIVDLLAFQQNNTIVDQQKAQLQELYFLLVSKPVIEEVSADEVAHELEAPLGDGGQVKDIRDVVALLALLVA